MDNIRLKIKTGLISLVDDEYKKFHSKLCPSVDNILGVRVPLIRNYAKKVLEEYSFYDLYNNIDNEYYEEIMLKGILIGLCVKDLEEVKYYINDFVPLIDNWAICDTFCSGLKIVKKNKDYFREFILSFLNSSLVYSVRFGLVMLLDYYIEEDYLEDNFKIFNSVKLRDYYVEMGLAWAISICFIKFFDETLCFLKDSLVSDFVYNKSISKACDSYRISTSKKNILKSMRRK